MGAPHSRSGRSGLGTASLIAEPGEIGRGFAPAQSRAGGYRQKAEICTLAGFASGRHSRSPRAIVDHQNIAVMHCRAKIIYPGRARCHCAET